MDLFVKLDKDAIRSGLIAKVGGVRHFSVLAAIAAFVDENGVAYPSQETIGELIGYSRKSVNQFINDLRKVKIDGEPILEIVQEKTPEGRRNKYILFPNSGFRFGRVVTNQGKNDVTNQGEGVVTESSQEEDINVKKNIREEDNKLLFNNAREILQYFRNQYYNKYGVVYSPNWVRDTSMIKKKLMPNYTDKEIKAIIDVVFEEYDKRWAKSNFPRPTIGQLCTWLPNQALAVLQQRKKEQQRIEKESEKYMLDDDTFQRLLDKI